MLTQLAEIARKLGLPPKGEAVTPRQWIGLLEFHGTDLREFTYPGYERQRYDGSPYLVFEPKNAPGPLRVAAMGLYHERTGNRDPIIIHLHAHTGPFVVLPIDTVRVAAENLV